VRDSQRLNAAGPARVVGEGAYVAPLHLERKAQVFVDAVKEPLGDGVILGVLHDVLLHSRWGNGMNEESATRGEVETHSSVRACVSVSEGN
jgi:hypothetical protein